MHLALDWMLENSRSTDAVIFTDSESLVISIESRQANVLDIIGKLQQLKGRVTIQWIPGHSNIPGNNLADKYA
jgi:ribonuclease HI